MLLYCSTGSQGCPAEDNWDTHDMSASSVQWISAHIKPMDVEKLTLHSSMINDAYTIPPLVYALGQTIPTSNDCVQKFG